MKKRQAYFRDNFFALIIISSAVLLFFYRYTGNLLQTDTYAKWFYTISSYRGQYRLNARYGEWLYMEFFYRVMGEPQHFRYFHVCVGLCLDIAIVFILWKIICGKIKSNQSWLFKSAALIVAVSLRANVFYTDIFQFGVDTASMFIGDLLAITAGWLVAEKTDKKGFIAGTILLCGSLFFRQTCLFWFVFIGAFIIICDTDRRHISISIRKMLHLFYSIMLAVIPTLVCINVISPSGSRGSFSKINLKASWESFAETFTSLLRDCDGVQPKGFYTSLLAVVLCVGIIMMILRVKTFGISDSLFIILKWLIITVCVFSGTFFSVLFESYLPHRTTYGFATILPLWILLIVFQLFTDEIQQKAIIEAVLVCVLLINLCVNYIYTEILYEGLVETNRVDQENARYYYDKILSYEEETGITVKNLAWHNDKWFTWNVPGVIGSKAINNRAYCFPWSRREIFPYTVNRRFTIVEYDDDLYWDHYGDINWDGLNDDQIMFIGDTVFIVLY